MRHAMTAATIALASTASAENRIDTIRPDAPALAAFGDNPIGVRTMTFTNPDQIDVARTEAIGDIPTYDRTLTVEVWYPASAGTTPGGTYTAFLRDGTTTATLTGSAARDAAPADARYPLVIISHGYPGNRFLLSHLGENLASKGYVVASIDHADSIYSDLGAFGSTLVNRPWDQRFVIDSLEALDDELGAVIDAENSAVIGYSMGGYGALIYAGAGVTEISTTYEWGAPQGLLERNLAGSNSHASLVDDRVKAIVAFGPWGMNTGFWDANGLAGVEKPVLMIAGSIDDVSVYDNMRDIFTGLTNTTRHLLTFNDANHNAGAPMPAPAESYFYSEALGFSPFEHYADAVWDNVRMNNISVHFITAYLDMHLKGADTGSYFELTENARDGVWAVDDAGVPTDGHTYWEGFPNRTAAGLRFETLENAR
ncbi:Predicted dienelactone hydrolase [Cognatiyoonia koreensis]|uniref:Predicted dienelactone hydrolase n=1 Tax=Cognatiyoonia koreensis TaxID=364200 RepID=A0A1I0Q949_9RHOB|nr:dienelactone hydrolase [Cognatiyoonia koreensis]SEW23532.1 Predicted dienelactone hydrolase [Cognatiyoonia koreensis]